MSSPHPQPSRRADGLPEADGLSSHSAVFSDRRLRALYETGLLDAPPEPLLEGIANVAKLVAKAPVALVSLVDKHRQYFAAAEGLPDPWASLRETPLSHSFCKHVVDRAAPLEVSVAGHNSVVAGNLAIDAMGVAAYLGVPLRHPNGETLGALCAVDIQPREWTSLELVALEQLSEGATEIIRGRLQRGDAESTSYRTASPMPAADTKWSGPLKASVSSTIDRRDSAAREASYALKAGDVDGAALNNALRTIVAHAQVLGSEDLAEQEVQFLARHIGLRARWVQDALQNLAPAPSRPSQS